MLLCSCFRFRIVSRQPTFIANLPHSRWHKALHWLCHFTLSLFWKATNQPVAASVHIHPLPTSMRARWWLHQTAGQTTTRVPSSQTTKQLCDYFVLFYFFSSLFLPFLAFADFIVVVSKINFNGTTYFLGFFFFFFWNAWHTVATITYLRPFSNTEHYHRICLS